MSSSAAAIEAVGQAPSKELKRRPTGAESRRPHAPMSATAKQVAALFEFADEELGGLTS